MNLQFHDFLRSSRQYMRVAGVDGQTYHDIMMQESTSMDDRHTVIDSEALDYFADQDGHFPKRASPARLKYKRALLN
jgi:hypothetical protein